MTFSLGRKSATKFYGTKRVPSSTSWGWELKHRPKWEHLGFELQVIPLSLQTRSNRAWQHLKIQLYIILSRLLPVYKKCFTVIASSLRNTPS